MLFHCVFCDKREDMVEYMIKPECAPLVRVYPLGVCGICADACTGALAIMRAKKPKEVEEVKPTQLMGYLGVGEDEVC